MNMLFERGNGFKKQVGNRLAVNLHQIGDLFIVHAFEVFQENGFFLAARQLVDCSPYFHLILGEQFIALDLCFDGLVIG